MPLSHPGFSELSVPALPFKCQAAPAVTTVIILCDSLRGTGDSDFSNSWTETWPNRMLSRPLAWVLSSHNSLRDCCVN